MDNQKYINDLTNKLQKINYYLPRFENNSIKAQKCIINILKRYNIMKQYEKYNPYISQFNIEDISRLTKFVQHHDQLKLEQQIIILCLDELTNTNKIDTLYDYDVDVFEELDDIDDLHQLFPNIF
tara:strand:- start:47 stop:421 length:375 start_codon:yes stop_codon:yes gene_type:complete